MSTCPRPSNHAPSLEALSEEFEQLLARGAGLLDRTGTAEAQLIRHRIAPLLEPGGDQADGARDHAEFEWPPSPDTMEECEVISLGQAIDWSPLMAPREPDGQLEAPPSRPDRTTGGGWLHPGWAPAAVLGGLAAAAIALLVSPDNGTPPRNDMSGWRRAEVGLAAEPAAAQVPVRELAPPILIEAALSEAALNEATPIADRLAPSVDRAGAQTFDAGNVEAPSRALLADVVTPVVERAVAPGFAATPVAAEVPSAMVTVAPLPGTVGAANLALPAAPPALAMSPTASTEPAAPPSTSERDGITSALGRFQAAYTELDARAAQQVWPSVDVRALERAFGGLKAQEVTFERCTVEVAGSEASALCRGRATYIGRIGRQTPQTARREWDFRLRKAGAGWTISSARIR